MHQKELGYVFTNIEEIVLNNGFTFKCLSMIDGQSEED